MNISFKKNVIVIVIAALLALGVGGAAVAIGVSSMPANRVSRYMGAAERYLSEMNYEQAIIEFQKIIEIETMNVEAYLGLADAYIGLGDIDNAIEILREGLEKTGDEHIKSKLDELTKKPETSTSSSSAVSSSTPVSSTTTSSSTISQPTFQPSETVTIWGEEYDTVITAEISLSYRHIINERLKEIAIELEKLINLTCLDLGDNYIRNITPLGNLTNLTELCLGKNQINDIMPLAKLTNLTELYLDFNQISDITPLASLTNLTRLGLTSNHISDITPIANLTNLTELYLNDNQISDIMPLAKLTNLTNLYLSYNQISYEDIEQLRLQLPNCNINAGSQSTPQPSGTVTILGEEYDIATTTGLDLSWCDITDAQLKEIAPKIAKLTNLTYLDLSVNQIRDITPLVELTSLTSLGLTNNQISDITPLAGLTNLSELWLYGNLITNADRDWLKPQLPNCDF